MNFFYQNGFVKEIKQFTSSLNLKKFFIDFYLQIMLLIYPLYWGSEKKNIYIILTFISFGAYFILRKEKGDKKITYGELIFGLAIISLLIYSMVYKNIEENFFYVSLFLNFYFLKIKNIDINYYVKLMSFSNGLVLLNIIIHYYANVVVIPGIENLVSDSNAILPWLLMVFTISNVLFCVGKRKIFAFFLLSLSSFVSILIYGDIISIFLALLSLLVIPQIYAPTVKIIKRNLIIFYSVIFLISNISLIVPEKIASPYDVLLCIFIDGLLMIVGIFILVYWRKIPVGYDDESILMIKFQRWYRYFLMTILIVLSNFIIGSISSFHLMDGNVWIKMIVQSIGNSLKYNDNTFYLILEQYGIIGISYWISLLIILARKLYKLYNYRNYIGESEKMCLIISGLFLVQTLFYKIHFISSPIYIIFSALAFSVIIRKSERLNRDKILSNIR